MAKKQGRWIIPLYQLISALPYPVAMFMGTLVGKLLFLLKGRDYHVTLKNIQQCFTELDEHEQKMLVRKSLINLAISGFEIPLIWQKSKPWLQKKIKQVEGECDLVKALEQGKGCIILTPHIGCWEICSHYIAWHAQKPFQALYKAPHYAQVDRLIQEKRTRFGQKLVEITHAPRVLLKALKDGSPIGILPDQDPGKNGSVAVPFFNIAVPTMTLAARLHQRTELPVFFIYAIRLPRNNGYKIIVSSFSDIGASVDKIAYAFNQEIEMRVRENPDQYQWAYKRFKQIPNFYS